MNNDLISKNHFDKRVREAVGMTISELTADFKDGVRTTLELLKTEPTVDAVPVKSIEQLKWERDTAIEQLEKHGIPFCGKADVVQVVRCGECKWWFKDENYDGLYRCANDGLLRKGDHYCADGERKDE